MIAEPLEYIREVVIPLEEPIRERRECSGCPRVMEYTIPINVSEDDVFWAAIDQEDWQVINNELLCYECAGNDPREDRYRKSDMKLDEMKDEGY